MLKTAGTMAEPIHIIGGGLAGTEAAWQVARRGLRAVLYEMRPGALHPRAPDRPAGRAGVQQFAEDRSRNLPRPGC